MRAKFISTTNVSLDKILPKNLYGNLETNEIAYFAYFTCPDCFHTSLVESYVYDKTTHVLTVKTLNSVYQFELDETPDEKEFKCARADYIEVIRILNTSNKENKNEN